MRQESYGNSLASGGGVLQPQTGLRLNLGCGRNFKREGWLGVDRQPKFAPDVLLELEGPWPWSNDSVIEVELSHVMEHIGQTTAGYFKFLLELYRVCRKGALIHIRVPHHRHEMLLNDPTHVRPITLEGLKMFDKELNENTRDGIPIDVNFKIVAYRHILDGYWEAKFQRGEISEALLEEAARNYNNVIAEFEAVWRVVKD